MATILVVDDENYILDLLTFILENAGHKIYKASRGEEALRFLGLSDSVEKPINPDLVILDIMIPDIDGFTIQNKMLQNENTRKIPIIILTAKGQMKDLFKMAPNVAAYIDKPFEPDLLSAKVKETIEKSKQ